MTPLPSIEITYPPELPVSARRDDISRAIRDNQVVIVAGATGSGKTTQLPKICLELGRERIGHTQPRRIAARSIAERIAEELHVELGGIVGYQVRFTDHSSAETRVKLMTDGVLLAEINRDRDLKRYDTIILDEAHERSLTIDFLLGYLKQLLPRRPELKVIVTSATIDPESFARHFASADGTPAPIIEVSGRTFPVDIRYRPLSPDAIQVDDPESGDEAPVRRVSPELRAPKRGEGARGSGSGSGGASSQPDGGRDQTQGILDALDELARETAGDVLVFLSGENEIRDAEDAIRGRYADGPAGSGTEVVPLYGRLSAADQHRVFDTKRDPGIRRRVVLATNVAETSLTVPGIRYVIDAGTARISRYSPRAKVQRLPIEAISQASATQRSGRAGRTSDGIAIRLYAEEDFDSRPTFTDPEILRTSLAAVILQMMSLGLGDIADFPFLQPPDSRGIKDGLDLLQELGAVNPDETTGLLRITKIGRDLARLPVDPRFGRMLLESRRTGTVREVAAIVSGLSIQDPRERPLEKRPQADASHARFTDPTSDFLSLLSLWNHLEKEQRDRSSSAFRRMCRAEYLNYLRVREWQDLYRQLLRAGKSLGLNAGDAKADPDGIHRALLAGLLSRIGIRDDRTKAGGAAGATAASRERNREFIGARAQRFSIFPGSALAKKPPPTVMAAELVETSRLFARTVAGIDTAWAESLAGDLAKRQFTDPHWERKQGAAIVTERVLLYGVPIVPGRKAQLARVDRPQARELFIRHALVGGEWPGDISRDRAYDFDRRNRAMRRELEDVEERTRRRDILVDDEAVVDFYEARIPADVATVRDFEAWWKRERGQQPDLLTMARADLLEADDAVDEEQYPSEWSSDDQRLRLDYRFEPGASDDGVTVEVPLALLPRVDAHGFDWLVPGMREELVTALIRTLPKSIRTSVVPAGDWARRLLAMLPAHPDGSLTERLAVAIRSATFTPVAAADFDLDRLPAHLRVTYAAVDERGRRLGASKQLDELQTRFADEARASVARVAASAAVAASRGADADPGRGPRPGSPAPGPAGPTVIERGGLTTFDLDELPRTIDIRQGGNTIRAYPAMVDDGSSIAIRVLGTAGEQAREHPRGIRRLLALATPNPTSYVQEHLTGTEKLALATSPYRSTAALIDDALAAAIDATVGDRLPFTRSEFEALRDEVSRGVLESVFAIVADAARVLLATRDADRAISSGSSLALMAPLADARAQLAALVHPGFIGVTGAAQLRRVPTYVAGITYRATRLAENPGRDRVWLTEVEQAMTAYIDAGGTLPLTSETPPKLRAVRWMLEELRLSLFAQQLGAAGPVSIQRITKALAG